MLARFDVDRHNLTRAAAWSRRTPEELLAVLATDRVPLILRLNPALVVADNVVHHQDLRRPLGLPLDVPTAHLRAALQSVMSLRVFAADAARVAGYGWWQPTWTGSTAAGRSSAARPRRY